MISSFKKIKSILFKNSNQTIIAIPIIAIIAIVGVYLLMPSHAQGPFTSAEAEKGVLSGSALIVNDSSTSNGEYVQFNASSGLIIGISDPDLISETATVRQSQLAQMKSIGINSVRVEMNQAWVQYNGSGSFDWSQMDPLMQDIHNAGL